MPGRRIINNWFHSSPNLAPSPMSRYTSKAARLTENIGRRASSVGSLFDQGSSAMILLLNAFGRSVGIDLEVYR